MRLQKNRLRHLDFSPFLLNAKKLSFEQQVLLGSQFITAISCFLPWASFDPLYGPSNFQNAFAGSSWLMGGLIFVLSLGGLAIFVDKILGKGVIKFRIPESLVFLYISSLSFILLICVWSVLRSVGQGYAGVELRFGLALCLIAQISALVSLWLQSKSAKKSKAEEFFQLPSNEKSRQSAKNHPQK